MDKIIIQLMEIITLNFIEEKGMIWHIDKLFRCYNHIIHNFKTISLVNIILTIRIFKNYLKFIDN